jgi:iron complex outermembrane receptor protein
MTRSKLLGLLAGLVPFVASPQLAAQDTPEDSGALEEVVITAEKREGTVQDTPISIAAFSGDELAQSGIVSTEALTTVAPGLNVQREVIGKVVIRGIGTENFSVGSDPGVAIHQDGVYLARSSTSVFEFFDTSRVEVLRGPQGTLYGRNATGGVLNIISNKPTSELEGYAKLDLGNYAKRRVEGALNVPFGESAAARFSILYAERDGYTENLFPGASARGIKELDNQDLWAARAQLRFDLSDAATLTFQGDISRDDSNPAAFKYFDRSNAFWFNPMGDQVLGDLRQVSQGYEQDVPGSTRRAPSIGRANTSGGNIKFEWDLGSTKFTSQTAYRKTDFSWLNDGDGFDQYFVTYFQDDDSKQFTQELQLASSGDSRFDWIIGGFYLDEKSKTFSGLAFQIGLPPPAINGILIDGESNTKSYSLFAQGTFDFTDRLRGTLGVRYTDDDKDGDLIYNLFGGVLPPPGPMGTTWPEVLNDSWGEVTPKIGLDFDFSDDVMGYISATRGFKSGGFNLIAVQAPYDPEFLWSYEVGLKTKSASGRTIANFGAFYYDYTDLQVGKIVNLSDVLTNAAEATVKGLEAEIRTKPTDALEINLGLAWLDSEYDEFCTEDPVASVDAPLGAAGGCPASEYQLAGKALRRAPKFSGNLGIAFEEAISADRIFRARADYAYKSKQYFTQFNREEVSQDGYGLINLRFGYGAADEKWLVTAFVDNVTDEAYFSTVLESGVANAMFGVVPQAVLGAPRTYGVSLRYAF